MGTARPQFIGKLTEEPGDEPSPPLHAYALPFGRAGLRLSVRRGLRAWFSAPFHGALKQALSEQHESDIATSDHSGQEEKTQLSEPRYRTWLGHRAESGDPKARSNQR